MFNFKFCHKMFPSVKLLRCRLPPILSVRRSFFDRFCKKETDDDCNTFNVELSDAFKLYNLSKEPKSVASLTKTDAKKLFVEMQTIRRLENACAALYQAKTIRGFCHLYMGQEACCVGIHSAMRPEDSIITAYRAHGWTWVMGVSVEALLAELCQKQSGCSRGKGGSMHTYAKHFYGGNGIVGAQVPLGVGVAFAHAYRCDGGVTFACYGDGAANQGQIHEVFNISCLWKLPVVFVCENNKYGMGTAIKRASCSIEYYTRGDYIPGLWVNGMDVLAVRNAAEFAINYARDCGPLVMELETYRYSGHSMSDPGTAYRDREEIQTVRQTRDPITTFQDICVKQGIVTEEECKQLDDNVKDDVNAAVESVKTAADSDYQELTTDVYMNCLEKNIRGITMRNLPHYSVGQTLVPLGTAKATPKSQIKEPEVAKKEEKTDKPEEKAAATQQSPSDKEPNSGDKPKD